MHPRAEGWIRDRGSLYLSYYCMLMTSLANCAGSCRKVILLWMALNRSPIFVFPRSCLHCARLYAVGPVGPVAPGGSRWQRVYTTSTGNNLSIPPATSRPLTERGSFHFHFHSPGTVPSAYSVHIVLDFHSFCSIQSSQLACVIVAASLHSHRSPNNPACSSVNVVKQALNPCRYLGNIADLVPLEGRQTSAALCAHGPKQPSLEVLWS